MEISDSNSPLPFSIPIELNTNKTNGKYKFTLSVYYSDNLRNIHHIIINGTTDIINLVQEGQNNKPSSDIDKILNKNLIFFIAFITIIIAFIIGILYARKRKKNYGPHEFGLLEKDNNEMRSKDNSLFENTTGLFDEEEDPEKK